MTSMATSGSEIGSGYGQQEVRRDQRRQSRQSVRHHSQPLLASRHADLHQRVAHAVRQDPEAPSEKDQEVELDQPVGERAREGRVALVERWHHAQRAKDALDQYVGRHDERRQHRGLSEQGPDEPFDAIRTGAPHRPPRISRPPTTTVARTSRAKLPPTMTAAGTVRWPSGMRTIRPLSRRKVKLCQSAKARQTTLKTTKARLWCGRYPAGPPRTRAISIRNQTIQMAIGMAVNSRTM